MVGTLRLFIDASYAVTLMAFVGIVAGFMTAAITSDTQRSLQVAIGIFAVTGALLTIRLWRTTRGTGSPPVDPTA
jgi:membrane protein implicated in regulation of membrane protease activity